MHIEKIINEVFAFPLELINDELLLRNIDTWDSMTHMILIVKIEETFDIQLSGDEIVEFQSIKDIKEALRKRDKL